MIFNERKPHSGVSKEWLLNAGIALPTQSQSFTARFKTSVSNKFYDEILISLRGIYYINGSNRTAVYERSWRLDGYRSLIFVEEPSGDLLACLQENGVPQ